MVVSETFYSIQGEGTTTGVPAVFLRLAGCNLLCESLQWRCDTIEVWRKGEKKSNEDVLTSDMIEHLKAGAHLVITGGEPLLHQADIVSYLEYLKSLNIHPYTEIETNGTLFPCVELENRIQQWNVSPKLRNSGETYLKRVNKRAILKLNSLHSTFKFVVSRMKDWNEIQSTYSDLINEAKVLLMPAGENQEQLEKSRPVAAELCKMFHVRYCDRIHIAIWNKKTGV